MLFILWAKSPVKVTFVYEDGVPKQIIAEGEVSSNQWLGVSFYPTVFKDAEKEGFHIVREIKAGYFNEEITIDTILAKHYNSSYEIALWGKRVDKKTAISMTTGAGLAAFTLRIFYSIRPAILIPSRKTNKCI